MNCGRWRGVSRVSRWVKFPRFSLNILFSLPATFIPFPKPTYRRLFSNPRPHPFFWQSIIRRRSSRDSTVGRKLSRSLICPTLSDPMCCFRSKDTNCLWISLAWCFDLTRKNRIINPSWSCRLFGHVKLIDPFYDPLFFFYLLSFFYLNSTDGWLLILAVIRQSKRVLIWVVYSNWKRWIRRFCHPMNTEKYLYLIKIYLN